MNIAIIGPAHPLRGGGISTFNERLAQALQDEGHLVTIYSFSLQYPSFLFPGKSQTTDEPAPRNLTIRTVINSVNPLNWFLVGNNIRRQNHDLVIVRYWLPFMGPSLGTILRRVKKNRHSRVVCIADNVIPHEKRPGDVAFTKYFLKPVDTFITMSRKVLDDLRTFTDKPALYTPHPLYDNYGTLVSQLEARRNLGLGPSEKYLLFFGFIRKYKGLDLLLDAMADPRIREAGLKLIIAGEFYDQREPYEKQIADLGLAGRLNMFTEFIPNEEVRYYFSAADLVVQPYHNATNSGITQLAYHFEKPMVVTNVGGLAEVVPDGRTGFVAEPEPASIATAILKFFAPGALPKLEEDMKAEKAKYAWNTFTERLLKLAFPESKG
jgi:glycosyltransferase involved in cell wall biosynthesis